MLKKLLIICLTLITALPLFMTTTAQETAPGQVRIVQIFYSNADIYIDDRLIMPQVAFTVGTDFLPLDAGTHTIAVVPADESVDPATTTTLEVAADHTYTLITMGEFEIGTPTYVTIDETTTFADYDPEGNTAIIVQNVPGAIPVDVWFLDALKIENLTFGTYGTASAPLGQFSARAVAAGQPDATVFESEYFAVPRTVSLAYLSGTFPDQINRTFFTTTADNLIEYLTAHVGLAESKLSTFYELITSAGLTELLAGDTPYTLFAPTNAAFAALPPETLAGLKNDPAALLAVLNYHLVEGYWGPYELTGEHTVTSRQGSPLEVVFQPVETPLSVNGFPTGLQHRVSNGVIYLVETVLMPPQP